MRNADVDSDQAYKHMQCVLHACYIHPLVIHQDVEDFKF